MNQVFQCWLSVIRLRSERQAISAQLMGETYTVVSSFLSMSTAAEDNEDGEDIAQIIQQVSRRTFTVYLATYSSHSGEMMVL